MLTGLLGRLLSPLSLVLELALLAALLRRRRPRAARALLVAACALLWTASMPWTARLLTGALERGMEPLPAAELPEADAVVVLGGATGSRLPPRRSPELVDASDRILHAARIYRARKAPLVLASGGRRPGSGPLPPEAHEMAELLAEWGVPRDAILLEPRSVDTRGNARESAPLLRARGVKRILLVTSASHMRRARAAFRKALGPGVEVVPAPTDIQAVRDVAPGLFAFVPDAAALQGTTLAVREWQARILYRVRGDLAP